MSPREDRRKAVGPFRVRSSRDVVTGELVTEESILRRYKRHLAGVSVKKKTDVDLDADVRLVPKTPRRQSQPLERAGRPSSLTFGGPSDDDDDLD